MWSRGCRSRWSLPARRTRTFVETGLASVLTGLSLILLRLAIVLSMFALVLLGIAFVQPVFALVVLLLLIGAAWPTCPGGVRCAALTTAILRTA